MRLSVAAACIAAIAVAVPVMAAPPTFELLPSGLGRGFAMARGISGNGEIIVGSGSDLGFEDPVLWRRSPTGAWQVVVLPAEGSPRKGRAISVSWNGDTIVGMTNLLYAPAYASGTPAIWTNVLSGTPVLTSPLDDGPMEEDYRGVFSGISADGSSIAGMAPLRLPLGQQPGELWTMSEGVASRLSPFPTTDSYITAILAGNPMSADGSVIVGSVFDSSRRVALRWSAETGFVSLDTPVTGDYRNSRAETISRDGLVIGGHLFYGSDDYGSRALPCLWTASGRTDLPLLPSMGESGRVVGFSLDGSVAIGVQYYGMLGQSPSTYLSNCTAVFWVGGQVYGVAEYLTARGIDLQGTQPRWLTGIVDDGITLVGFAGATSFIMTLETPCGPDLSGDGLVDFSDYLEFLNLFEASEPRVDFNHDGVVDFADYLEFLNLFEVGC